MKLAPLSVQVFSYTKPETGAASNKRAKAKTAAKAATEKKTGKNVKSAGKPEEAVKVKKTTKTAGKQRKKYRKNGEKSREKAGNHDCDREGRESRKAGDRQQTGENGGADGG